MSANMPNNDWSLNQLAEFCVTSIRRSGEDAWKIGKALSIARSRHKENGDWLRWLREEVDGLGQSTAYRYIEVFNKLTLDQVRSLSVNEIYELIRIEKEASKPKVEVLNSDDDGQDGEGKADAVVAADEMKDESDEPTHHVGHRSKKSRPDGTSKPSWVVDDNDLFKSVTTAIASLKECLAVANWESLDETQRATISAEAAELKALLDDVDQKLAVE
jgi:hypothetical protein